MNEKRIDERKKLWDAVEAWSDNQKYCFDCNNKLEECATGLIREYGTVHVCHDCDMKALKRNRVKKLLQPVYDALMKDKNI